MLWKWVYNNLMGDFCLYLLHVAAINTFKICVISHLEFVYCIHYTYPMYESFW